MLDMNKPFQKKDVLALVSELKHTHKNMYHLSPVQVGEFLKIRSNFIKMGIVLSNELLSQPDNDVVEYIIDRLKNTRCGDTSCYTDQDVSEFDLKNALEVDVSTIEDERTEIRKHLFNENISVVIERIGRVFNVSWNSKMTVCKISVPSGWQLNMSKSLLYDVEEKDNKFFDAIDSKLTYLGSLIYNMLSRHSDYTIIKRLLELEIESNKESILKSIDKRKLNKLRNRGLSLSSSIVLLGFLEQIQTKTFSASSLSSILGFRKRLINEFNTLLSKNN